MDDTNLSVSSREETMTSAGHLPPDHQKPSTSKKRRRESQNDDHELSNVDHRADKIISQSKKKKSDVGMASSSKRKPKTKSKVADDESSSDESFLEKKKKPKKSRISKEGDAEPSKITKKKAAGKSKIEKDLEEAGAEIDDDDEEESMECEREIAVYNNQHSITNYYKTDDFVVILVDEIALEGLDGITLEALWLRLSETMSTKCSLNYRTVAWDFLTKYHKMEFYQLTEARPKLVIFDRCQYIDFESGHICEPEEYPVDVYPFAPIPDEVANNDKVFGSCATYGTRKNITNSVRTINLEKAESFGNKLVIVADQGLRYRALGLGDCKNLTNFSMNVHYCLLERIGRTRRYGESSSGKNSLQQITDSKTLYYLRKILLSRDLITKQHFCLKSKKHGNSAARVFHLKRFFNEYKPRKVVIIEQILDILKKKPKHMIEYMELKSILGLRDWNYYVKKVLKGEMKQFCNTNMMVPYRTLYPNAPEDEWMSKSERREKNLRVIELTNPPTNVLACLKDSGKEAKEEQQQKNESSDEEDFCAPCNTFTTFYKQIYDAILKSGAEGIALREMQQRTGGDAYVIRLILRHLTKLNLIQSLYADIGRQHMIRYFADGINKKESTAKENSVDERLDFVSDVFGIDKEKIVNETVIKPIILKTRGLKELPSIEKSNSATLECPSSVDDIENVTSFSLNYSDQSPQPTNSAIDYRKIRHQIANWKMKTGFVYRLLGPTKNSPKILIDYVCLTTNTSTNSLLDKFNEIILSINSQKIRNCLEYPKILTSDDEDEEKEHESVSLIEHFEDVEYERAKLDDEVNSFKETQIHNFEYEEHKFAEDLLDAHTIPCVVLKAQIKKNNDQPQKKKNYVKQRGKELQSGISGLDEILKKKVETTREFSSEECLAWPDDYKIEKYLGSKITVRFIPADKDNIETLIIYSENSNKNIEPGTKYVNRMMSKRSMDRANYILHAVYKDKIIADIPKMLRSLKQEELNKKLIGQLDKKSIDRLMGKLVCDGFLKTVKIILRYNTFVRTNKIISLPMVDYTSFIESAIDQMKMSFFRYYTMKTAKLAIEEKTKNAEEISSTLQEIEVISGQPKYKLSRSIGRYYGCLPKCSKNKLLHEFLYYIIYSYDGKLLENYERRKLIKQTNFNLKEIAIYKTEVSWKMFIPPPPTHKGYPAGSVRYCDVLLRIPICIFTKIFNLSFVIPELLPILNDPIRKNLLLKDFPPKIRNACFYKRKYIYSIYEILQHLCYLGLLQFGEQSVCSKDQQFIYLNKNAIIYDTTSTNPGYHQTTEKEYPKLSFRFDNDEDVEQYWNKVWSISIRTRLGLRDTLLGQTITLQNIHAKPEMIEATKPKSSEVALACDVGYIPGDGRGACGFDTCTWMSVKRNWVHSTTRREIANSSDTYANRPIGIRKKYMDNIKSKPIKYKELQKELLKKKSKKSLKTLPIESRQITKASTKFPITRKIKKRPSRKPQKHKEDELDKTITKKMGLSRWKFSEDEDNKLIIIHYVLQYLFSSTKKKLISNTIVRDIMHKLCPKVIKTSRAYYTRLLKKMRIHRRTGGSCYCLEADKFVVKHFSWLRERISFGENIPQEHLHIAVVYLTAHAIDCYEQNSNTSQKRLNEDAYVDYLGDGSIIKVIEQMATPSKLVYSEPVLHEDITVDTVKGVIHSSLGWEVQNTNLYIQLANIYQRYREDVLQKAMSTLRQHQMITTIKRSSKASQKKKGENLVQNSYIYSFKRITKYPDNIYIMAYSFFKGIVGDHSEKQFCPEKYEPGHGIALCEMCCSTQVKFSISVPDELLVIDPEATDQNYFIEELDLRFKKLIGTRSDDQDVDKTVTLLDQQTQLEDGNNMEVVHETTSSNGTKRKFGEIEDSVYVDKPAKKGKHDNNEALEELRELSTFINEKNLKNKQIRSKVSDLAYLLTKGLFPESEDDDERLEILSKYILIMCPTFSFTAEAFHRELWCANIDEISQLFSEISNNLTQNCIFPRDTISNEQIHEEIYKIGNKVDVRVSKQLIAFLETKESFGATSNDLKERFCGRTGVASLSKIVERLINVGVIHRVGVRTFRFIHTDFKNDWSVTIEYQQHGDDIGYIGDRLKPAPWIRLNGDLNKKVFIDWIRTIQSHCISCPFIAFPALCKRFKYLKPVDIFTLLECLEKLSCIILYVHEETPEVTLFSSFSDAEEREANFLDDFENIFIETDEMAITKLGAFENGYNEDLIYPFKK